MKRIGQLAVLTTWFLLATGLGTGCNLMALPFFLMPEADVIKPKCKLSSEDKEKEVRVIILASTGVETRPEFLRVDRELSRLLDQQLQKAFKSHKEKVTVVPFSQVEKYKDEHQNWRAMPPADIGKYFEADYVINLTINSVSLYEHGSSMMLYRGHADISIDVVDVSKPSEGPIYEEEYSVEYPKAKGPIAVDGSNPAQFRQLFLSKVARELSWRFSPHLTDDDFQCD